MCIATLARCSADQDLAPEHSQGFLMKARHDSMTAEILPKDSYHVADLFSSHRKSIVRSTPVSRVKTSGDSPACGKPSTG